MEARRVETISARVDASSAATGRTAIARAFSSSSTTCVSVRSLQVVGTKRDAVQNSPFVTGTYNVAA